jgi:hypothetical protein
MLSADLRLRFRDNLTVPAPSSFLILSYNSDPLLLNWLKTFPYWSNGVVKPQAFLLCDGSESGTSQVGG